MADDETKSAITIQSMYKGHRERKKLIDKKKNLMKKKGISKGSATTTMTNDDEKVGKETSDGKDYDSANKNLNKEISRASRSVVGKRNKHRANQVASNHRSDPNSMRSANSGGDDRVSGAATIVTSIGKSDLM